MINCRIIATMSIALLFAPSALLCLGYTGSAAAEGEFHQARIMPTVNSCQYSDCTTFKAALLGVGIDGTDPGTPVAGAEISFAVEGKPIGSAITGSCGVAAVSARMFFSAEPYVVSASFAGDEGAGLLGHYRAAWFFVQKENAKLYIYGRQKSLRHGDEELSCIVKEENDKWPGDITKASPVIFRVFSSAGSLVFSGETQVVEVSEGKGIALTSVPPHMPGSYTVRASLLCGDCCYHAPEITVKLDVVRFPKR